ncbi:MAG: HAD family hydrolase [Cytophagales bacterium]|nr:HAD family hydrolase [Cytophagales bacterium]
MKQKNWKVIAFDADDTLWINEPIFSGTVRKFEQILDKYLTIDAKMEEEIYQREKRNLSLFGYGIKAYTLSLIETAIEITEGRITGDDIQKVLDIGKDMLAHPIELIEGVQETIEQLGALYELMVITKGDLFDQENKLARSGLADSFKYVEIVSEKDKATYSRLLKRHELEPEEIMMVGNSLKSDVLPVLELGGQAVHIPFRSTWIHEQVAEEQLKGLDFIQLKNIRELMPFLVKKAYS